MRGYFIYSLFWLSTAFFVSHILPRPRVRMLLLPPKNIIMIEPHKTGFYWKAPENTRFSWKSHWHSKQIHSQFSPLADPVVVLHHWIRKWLAIFHLNSSYIKFNTFDKPYIIKIKFMHAKLHLLLYLFKIAWYLAKKNCSQFRNTKIKISSDLCLIKLQPMRSAFFYKDPCMEFYTSILA